MNASRPDNETIFHAARDIPNPDRRREYVREACGGDEARIAQVEALLTAAAGPDSLLDRPAAGTPVGTIELPTTEQLDTVIGPYKLIEQIGEGGMGTVWMARQTEPVKRLVAVKVIKPGMDSRQVIARFEAERQALALMDHPNIARVFDAGTTDSGRPYFVMELVKGQALTKYCDEHRLTPKERLELFIPVCQAIQHAHQKGIIHRDVKPSNVLVALYDGKPVPKVIDFGVAKATGQQLTEHTLVTGFGDVVGTLEYMSPEQAEVNQLDIDTRSDIYSLGVLLYELLTGTTPLDRKRLKQAAVLEMLRMIREEEPPKPSTRLSDSKDSLASISAQRHTEPAKLTRLVHGELDWIVMKALDKDRNRRYETANGFAMDVQRYLADETVLACPPSAGYWLRKVTRKNWKLLATAGAFVIVLMAGVVVSATQWWRAERQRDRAEENFRQAKSAVDDFYTHVSETTLLDKPGLQPLRAELLLRALKYYQDLLGQRRDDPRFQAEIARAHLRLFTIHIAMSSGDEAYSALQTALEIIEPLIEAKSADAETAASLAGFWNVERLLFVGRTGGLGPSDRARAMAILEKGAELWEKLAADHPTAPGFRNDLAAFSRYMGDFKWDRGQPLEALREYEKAARLRENLVNENPQSREYRAALAEARNGVSWFLKKNGHWPEAEVVCRQAVTLQEQLATEFPEVPNYRVVLASCYENLSHILRQNGRLDEAGKASRRELEITEKLVAQFPDVPSFEVELAKAHISEAGIHGVAGRCPEAEKSYRRAIEIYERLSAQFPGQPNYVKEQGWDYWWLSGLLAACGKPVEAEDACRHALPLFEKFLTTQPAMVNYRGHVENIRSQLIGMLRAANRLQDVGSIHLHAIAFYQGIVARFPTDTAYQRELARQHHEFGVWLQQTGRKDEGEVELGKAEELWRRFPDPAAKPVTKGTTAAQEAPTQTDKK